MDLILNSSTDVEDAETDEPIKPILSENDKIEAYLAHGKSVLVASGIFFGKAPYLVSFHDSRKEAEAAYEALDLRTASEDGITINIRSPH